MADINSNILGLWKLNEGSGTTALDSSGNANPGTSTGGTIPYVVGSAYPFALNPQANQYESIGQNISVLQPAGNLSIAARFKTSSTTSQETIFASYSQTGGGVVNGITLTLNPDGTAPHKVGILIGWGSSAFQYNIAYSSTSVDDGNLHDVVVTWDGSTMTVYVDGVADGTPVSLSSGPIYGGEGNSLIYIGAQHQNGAVASYWSASGNSNILADVRLFGRALTAADALAYHNFKGSNGTMFRFL